MSADAYDDLVARVDELDTRIQHRRATDLACRRGCSACCHVQLTLAPVEAQRVRRALDELTAGHRARVRERALELAARDGGADGEACVMLEADGACAVYAHRPLVCRTQGHALRYSGGSLDEGAVFAVVAGSEITWCPLNYVERPPRSEDVLEAESIDGLLGHACHAAGLDPLARVSLIDLAARTDSPQAVEPPD